MNWIEKLKQYAMEFIIIFFMGFGFFVFVDMLTEFLYK